MWRNSALVIDTARDARQRIATSSAGESKFLPMAFVVLEAAGFIYNCTFVWLPVTLSCRRSFVPMRACDFALYLKDASVVRHD